METIARNVVPDETSLHIYVYTLRARARASRRPLGGCRRSEETDVCVRDAEKKLRLAEVTVWTRAEI